MCAISLAAVVLTAGGDFRWLSLADGSPVGHIPAWSAAPVTCFDFSRDGSRLLVGCADGSIYIVDVDSLFVLHGMRAPKVYEMYDVDTGKKWKYDVFKKILLDKDDTVVKKTAHNIEIRPAYKFAKADYFSHGVQLSVGYINDRLVQKFYFGAMVEPLILFPNKDFPYEYSVGNVILANPCLLSLDLKLLIGKEWRPFQSYPDIKFITEANFGGSFKKIVSFSIGSGDFVTSLFGGGTVGVGWKIISLYTTITYDTILRFNISAGLAFKLRVSVPKFAVTEDFEIKEELYD